MAEKQERREGEGTQSNFLPSFSLSWAGLGLSSSSSSSFSLQRREGGGRNRKRAIRRLLRRRRGHTRRGPRGEIGRFSPRTVLRRRLACFLPPGGKQGEGGGGVSVGRRKRMEARRNHSSRTHSHARPLFPPTCNTAHSPPPPPPRRGRIRLVARTVTYALSSAGRIDSAASAQ